MSALPRAVLVLAASLLAACAPESLGCDTPETCHRPVPGEPGTCEAEAAATTHDCSCTDGLVRYWDCERFAPAADAGADGG